MKTKLFLLALLSFVLVSVSSNAQSKYSGELDFGYSLCIEEYVGDALNAVNFSTTHGVKFNDRFFAGAGVAVDYFYDLEALVMPIYANAKAFLPFSEKSAAFASFDCGYAVGLSNIDGGGFYCCPAVGVKLGSIKFQVGYNYLDHLGSIQFKVGWML